MKKILILTILFSFTIIVSMASLGFNIYFLTTVSSTADGIFSISKDSVVEMTAETEDIGINYGSSAISIKFETIITNALAFYCCPVA